MKKTGEIFQQKISTSVSKCVCCGADLFARPKDMKNPRIEGGVGKAEYRCPQCKYENTLLNIECSIISYAIWRRHRYESLREPVVGVMIVLIILSYGLFYYLGVLAGRGGP